MDFGIQMYSLRDLAQSDLRAALEAVAAQGYKNIEFAGFFGHGAAEVKGWLDSLRLTASGTHTGYRALIDDIDGQIAYHHAIGCKHVIIPGTDLSSKENIEAFIEQSAAIQKKLAEAGLTLSYHNHSREFQPNADGSVAYDALVERTKLTLELDTFWAYAAGKDPVALMEQLRPRLRFIHIKDGLLSGEGKPLGQGTAPVKAVYEKAKAYGIPMIVESETLTPDGPTECGICAEWMKAQES